MIGTPSDLLSAALSMDTTWPDDPATTREWLVDLEDVQSEVERRLHELYRHYVRLYLSKDAS